LNDHDLKEAHSAKIRKKSRKIELLNTKWSGTWTRGGHIHVLIDRVGVYNLAHAI
jgi:hypothetical protein